MIPSGTPTPAPIATACELDFEDAAGVDVAGVVFADGAGVVLVEEDDVDVEVEELDVLVLMYVRGICATKVAAGFIANMSLGVSQHSNDPTPAVPLSQQYEVVCVIDPSQNLIPAVESVASGASQYRTFRSGVREHTNITLIKTGWILPCWVCTSYSQIILHITVRLLAHAVGVADSAYPTARAVPCSRIVASVSGGFIVFSVNNVACGWHVQGRRGQARKQR